MRTAPVMVAFALVVALGGYAVYRGAPRGPGAAPVPTPVAATGTVERGRAFGAFDESMSGVCRYSCAAPQPYEAKDVAIQPGVAPGALTQCPVSGVVFAADGGRPRVSIVTGEYVFCCDGCAKRFRRNPGRFVSL
jgi:hypothetical protein